MNELLGQGLEGRVVVVTGGARGIGAATADAFESAGALVAVVDRDKSALDEQDAADRLTIVADVADPGAVDTAVEQVVDRFGRLDVLVANAGISYRGAALDIPPGQWSEVLQVNLSGVFYSARAAARVMSEGGSVLLMGSTNGLTGHVNYAAYNAAKAGVIALARTLALELAPAIRVNAVCPGYVLTDMQRAEYTPEMLAEVDARIPLRRHARPEEIAALFVFLASDWGAYITGQPVVIDGGELA